MWRRLKTSCGKRSKIHLSLFYIQLCALWNGIKYECSLEEYYVIFYGKKILHSMCGYCVFLACNLGEREGTGQRRARARVLCNG